MSCTLYGFTLAKEKKDLGIAAVTGKPLHENLEGLNREKLVQALLQHQQKLETIMKTQFILPCKFGTLLKDETEVQEILSQNAPALKEWLNRMKDRCEMEVVATWNPQKILKEIAARDPEIARLKMGFAKFSLEEQEKNRLSIGIELSAKLKEEAGQYAKYILNRLLEINETYATHALMNDAMVFNTSFLLVRGDEDSFFKALEVLDKHFEGKLHFKCVGPLPPHSFATIQVKRFAPEEILKASQALGFNGEMNLKKVKQAYKLKARQCHPDTHSELSQKEFEKIHRDYKLLMDYLQGDAKPIQLSLLDLSKEIR